MMGVLLACKVLCRLRVHSVEAWEYRQDSVCTQDGACRWCGAPREQIKHEYPRRGGKVARTTCNRCKHRAARQEGVTDLFFGGSDGGGGDGGGAGE